MQVRKFTRELTAHKDWVLGLTMTPDGKTLVSGDDKGQVIVWDRAAGKELRRWKLEAAGPGGWAFLPTARKPLSPNAFRWFSIPALAPG